MKHFHHMTLDIFVSICHCSVLSVTSVHQQHRLEYIKAMLISLTGSHITSQTLCLWLQSEQNDPPHVFLALPPSWPRSPGSDTVTVSQRAGISWRLTSSETVRGNPPTLTGDWGIQLVTDRQTEKFPGVLTPRIWPSTPAPTWPWSNSWSGWCTWWTGWITWAG